MIYFICGFLLGLLFIFIYKQVEIINLSEQIRILVTDNDDLEQEIKRIKNVP